MKSYTDIEQSKKLADILPLESADMRYHTISQYNLYPCDEIVYTIDFGKPSDIDIPCWSLDALLDYLSANFRVDIKYLDNYWELDCRVQVTYGKELVDACYEMIVKFKENNLL